MRDELLPDDYDKQRAARKANCSSHGKQKKKAKCSKEMQYNKFQMQDIKIASYANSNSTPHVTSPDKSPVHSPINTHQSVESDVQEIRRYLRTLIDRIYKKEERNKIALEWRIIALVMDRLFFFMYLAAIIISLATIFPKTH